MLLNGSLHLNGFNYPQKPHFSANGQICNCVYEVNFYFLEKCPEFYFYILLHWRFNKVYLYCWLTSVYKTINKLPRTIPCVYILSFVKYKLDSIYTYSVFTISDKTVIASTLSSCIGKETINDCLRSWTSRQSYLAFMTSELS